MINYPEKLNIPEHRTHLKQSEVFEIISLSIPHLSTMTIIDCQKEENIKPIGSEYLLSTEKVNRLYNAILQKIRCYKVIDGFLSPCKFHTSVSWWESPKDENSLKAELNVLKKEYPHSYLEVVKTPQGQVSEVKVYKRDYSIQ